MTVFTVLLNVVLLINLQRVSTPGVLQNAEPVRSLPFLQLVELKFVGCENAFGTKVIAKATLKNTKFFKVYFIYLLIF